MLRTISLLALALLAHVTLVAALAQACGPQYGNHQFSNNYSHQHHKSQFQLGNRTNHGINNGLGLIAKSAQRPQTTIANQSLVNKLAANQPKEQLLDHPSDLPTNDPPVAASLVR